MSQATPDEGSSESAQPPGAVVPTGPGSDPWAISSTLLSGLIVWGGAGWLADRWLGTSFLTLIGLLVGMATGMYLVFHRTLRR